MDNVAILVPTYNSYAVIQKCLTSIPAGLLQQVYIIDNASQDYTLKLIKKEFREVNVYQLNQNLGYGQSVNFGINQLGVSDFKYILVVNPDVEFHSNSIQNLVRAAEIAKHKGIFGPKILNNNRIWSTGGIIDRNRFTAGLINFGKSIRNPILAKNECDFISGTCVLIPSSLLLQGLRFFTDYFMYYEDVEFSLAARKLGYSSFYIETSVIGHLEISEKFEFKNIKNYYLARNHLLFVERNAPNLVKLREVLRLPKTILDHFHDHDSASLSGIADYLTRKFGKHE